jgi:hypothetical protein
MASAGLPRRVALFLTCLMFAACGGSGGSGPPPQVPPPPPAPTVALWVAQSALPADTRAALSWNSTNADACVASEGWSGARALQGQEATELLFSSGTYTLTCTGAGGSISQSVRVEITPVVDVKTAATVRHLDAVAQSLLVDSQPAQLTFNGTVAMSVGEVFIVNDLAFKATSVSVAGGQTIVGVQQPSLEELFEKIEIAGAFDFTGSTAAIGMNKQSPYGEAQKITIPVEAKLAGFSFTSTFSGDVKINAFKYDFTLAEGLRSTRLDMIVSGGIDSSSFTATPFKAEIKRVSPPLRLPLPGVPFTTLDLAAGVTLAGEVEFDLKGNLQAYVGVHGKGTYTKAEGVNGSVALVDSRAALEVTTYSDSYHGSPLSPSATADIKLLLLAVPAISALGVPLITADLGVGPKMSAMLSGTGGAVCLQLQHSAVAEGELRIPYVTQSYEWLAEKEFAIQPPLTVGDCKLPLSLSTKLSPENEIVINDPLEVEVTASDGTLTGNPVGTLMVELDNETCSAALSKTGRCSLNATMAGKRTVQVRYSGDAVYAAAQSSALIEVLAPRIAPAIASLAAGSEITLALFDDAGRPIKLPQDAVWSASDNVNLIPMTDLASGRETRWRAANNAPTTDVVVTVQDGEKHFATQAVVHIVAPNEDPFAGTYNITSTLVHRVTGGESPCTAAPTPASLYVDRAVVTRQLADQGGYNMKFYAGQTLVYSWVGYIQNGIFLQQDGDGPWLQVPSYPAPYKVYVYQVSGTTSISSEHFFGRSSTYTPDNDCFEIRTLDGTRVGS